jgi:hypothetical protein
VGAAVRDAVLLEIAAAGWGISVADAARGVPGNCAVHALEASPHAAARNNRREMRAAVPASAGDRMCGRAVIGRLPQIVTVTSR